MAEVWINVKDYGAVGDGVTDDTDAIRDALVFLHTLTDPTTLYFPSGTYVFSGKITDPEWPRWNDFPLDWFSRTMNQAAFFIRRSDVTILGNGTEETILSLKTRDSYGNLADPMTTWLNEPNIGQGDIIFRGGAFRVGNSTQVIENITFANLRLTGNCTATLDHTVGGVQATGDGWDMSHKGIIIGGAYAVPGFIIRNCYLDRFRGEIVYAGGTEPTEISVIETIIEECNASAHACSAICLLDQVVFRDVYNAVECYAVGVGQRITASHCTFERTSVTKPGTHGIVYEGRPGCSSDALIQQCVFNGVYRAIYIAGGCDQVVIDNCDFIDNGSCIFIGAAGDDKHFYNIDIGNCDFNTPNGVAIVFNSYGLESENITIHDNNVVAKIFLSDTASNRTNCLVTENIINADLVYAIEAGNVNRALWVNNIYPFALLWPHCKSGTDRQDIYEATGTIQPSREYFVTQIFGSGSCSITITGLNLYPPGYVVTIERFGTATRAASFLPNPTWNTFTEPVNLFVGQPVYLRLNVDQLFELYTPTYTFSENPSGGAEGGGGAIFSFPILSIIPSGGAEGGGGAIFNIPFYVFNEVTSGGAQGGGCAIIEYINRFPIPYGPGSTVYSRPHALKGILRKIVIKTPYVRKPPSYSQYIPIYLDTENGLWNESELLPYHDAVILIRNYLSEQLILIEKANPC
jgi:hypothetical protein